MARRRAVFQPDRGSSRHAVSAGSFRGQSCWPFSQTDGRARTRSARPTRERQSTDAASTSGSIRNRSLTSTPRDDAMPWQERDDVIVERQGLVVPPRIQQEASPDQMFRRWIGGESIVMLHRGSGWIRIGFFGSHLLMAGCSPSATTPHPLPRGDGDFRRGCWAVGYLRFGDRSVIAKRVMQTLEHCSGVLFRLPRNMLASTELKAPTSLLILSSCPLQRQRTAASR